MNKKQVEKMNKKYKLFFTNKPSKEVVHITKLMVEHAVTQTYAHDGFNNAGLIPLAAYFAKDNFSAAGYGHKIDPNRQMKIDDLINEFFRFAKHFYSDYMVLHLDVIKGKRFSIMVVFDFLSEESHVQVGLSEVNLVNGKLLLNERVWKSTHDNWVKFIDYLLMENQHENE